MVDDAGLLTVPEAAELIGVSRQYVYRLVRSRALPVASYTPMRIRRRDAREYLIVQGTARATVAALFRADPELRDRLAAARLAARRGHTVRSTT